MTKEYLLSKTLYGVDIIQHLIRKEYPDYIMHIQGEDCGENPDPVYADGRIIQITVDKTIKAGQRLPERKARYHYLDESLPDGDAIALATAYWHERGEQLTNQQVIDRLASELYIYEEDYNPYNPNPRKSETVPEKKPEPPKNATCTKIQLLPQAYQKHTPLQGSITGRHLQIPRQRLCQASHRNPAHHQGQQGPQPLQSREP